MKKSKLKKSKIIVVVELALIVVLILSLGLFTFLSYENYSYFNSDSVNEIFYAKQMHDTGSLLPNSWNFSTEVRLLHNSLISAPLFCFTENLMLVKTLTTVIIACFICISTIYLMRSLAVSWGNSLIVAILSVAPLNIYHLDNLLISCYYSFFWIVTAGSIGFVIKRTCDSKQKPKTIGWGVLCLLSVVMGMCGIRYFMLFFCPLIGVELISIVFQSKHKMQSIKGKIMLCVSGVIGFVFSKVLQTSDVFPTASLPAQKLVPIKEIPLRILYVIKNSWLFETNYLVGSLVILIIIFSAVFLVKKWSSLSNAKTYYIHFAFCVNIINYTVLTLTYFDKISFVPHRYTFLSLLFLLPLIGLAIDELDIARLPKLAIVVKCFVLGIIIAMTFSKYVVFPNRLKTSNCQEEVTEFLIENDLTTGYASYWIAGVIEFRSDMKVTIAPVSIAEDDAIAAFPWLCPKSYFTEKFENPQFIILNKQDAKKHILEKETLLFSNKYYYVYQYDDKIMI